MQSMVRRSLLVLMAIPFGIGVLALTFADRAPGLVGRVLGMPLDLLRGSAVGRKGASAPGAQTAEGVAAAIPLDVVGHLVLWFAVGLLIASLAYGLLSVRSLIVLALSAAVGFELAQGLLTAARSVSLLDGIANVTGVLLGIALAWWAQRLWDQRPRMKQVARRARFMPAGFGAACRAGRG